MGERLESRSERRLHKRLKRAVEDRERKREAGRISLKSGDGKLVIIASHRENKRSIYNSEGKAAWFFRREAERLEEEREGDHQDVVVRCRAVPKDMRADFGDPEVTDIILIGNGNISSIYADPKGYFDWWDAAKAAVTLKQGRIEQRMCGDFTATSPYHVPLGTFAADDLTNIIAAPGKVIPDNDPPEGVFQPVYSSPDDPLGQIQALNESYRGNNVIIDDNSLQSSL